MDDFVAILIVIVLCTLVVTGVIIGTNASTAREMDAKCADSGYVEAFKYRTQHRYFCIGQNGNEWRIVPVEQLEAE